MPSARSRRRSWRPLPWLGLLLAVAAGLAGCGRKAEPLPPVVRRAAATRDLAAAQVGSEAVIVWSYPAMTSAGGALPDLEAVELWRAAVPLAQEPVGSGERDRLAREALLLSQGERLAVLETDALAAATRGSQLEHRDDLDAWRSGNPAVGVEQVLWYAVRSRCCGGRLSDLSNIARLAPTSPPPAPEELEAVADAAGIELRWRAGEGLGVVVERSEEGVEWLSLTSEPVSGQSWRDVTASQGRLWRYRLRSVRTVLDGARVVGPPSPELAVDHPDRYPPEVPVEVVCLPEGRRIRVRWRPSPEAAEYRVQRRVGNGPWELLASDLATSEFDDERPPAGELTYGVVAVDAAGNASEASTCSAIVGGEP